MLRCQPQADLVTKQEPRVTRATRGPSATICCWPSGKVSGPGDVPFACSAGKPCRKPASKPMSPLRPSSRPNTEILGYGKRWKQAPAFWNKTDPG